MRLAGSGSGAEQFIDIDPIRGEIRQSRSRALLQTVRCEQAVR
jgi:hypothetical protein